MFLHSFRIHFQRQTGFFSESTAAKYFFNWLSKLQRRYLLPLYGAILAIRQLVKRWFNQMYETVFLAIFCKSKHVTLKKRKTKFAESKQQNWDFLAWRTQYFWIRGGKTRCIHNIFHILFLFATKGNCYDLPPIQIWVPRLPRKKYI